MEHANHLVDLVDKTGKVVGQKRRRDIDKLHDLYHSVHTLLISPIGELILTNIPKRDDLPNLYANKLGATAATIRRSHETADQAAARSVSRELFIDNAPLHLLGTDFYTFQNGQSSYMSAYYLVANPPATYSHTDSQGFATLSPRGLRKQLVNNPLAFAASFVGLWSTYKAKLPL